MAMVALGFHFEPKQPQQPTIFRDETHGDACDSVELNVEPKHFVIMQPIPSGTEEVPRRSKPIVGEQWPVEIAVAVVGLEKRLIDHYQTMTTWNQVTLVLLSTPMACVG